MLLLSRLPLLPLPLKVSEQQAVFRRLVLELEERRHCINTASRKRLRVHFDAFLLEKEMTALQRRREALGKKGGEALALHKANSDEMDRLKAIIAAVKVSSGRAWRLCHHMGKLGRPVPLQWH